MNAKFDEPAKALTQLLTTRRMLKKFSIALTGIALSTSLEIPVIAQVSTLGPAIELSFPNPVGACDDGFSPGGSWTLQDAGEPCVASDPSNPKNLVVLWMGGSLQNIASAVSFDSGATWQRGALPFTQCAGGPYLIAGDPWVCFGSGNTVYASALLANIFSGPALVLGVCRSSDGGLSWSTPVFMAGAASPDHPSITGDPTDARFAYAIWDEGGGGGRGTSVFSRTTNGGLSWETARTLVQPAAQNGIQFSQILVLPDGTLVDLYEQFFSNQTKKPVTQTSLQLLRSTDHGQTWSAPITAVNMTPFYLGPTSAANGWTSVIDPETGTIVQDPTNPSFAVDRRNGNLYAVWEDGRFSNFAVNDIAFSMSSDGGFTWSSPIRVNQTPSNIPISSRQSFLPNIAVAGNGTIGVSYYDFRFNTPEPGLPTDRWLAICQPSPTNPATNALNWVNEIRLAPNSFNMQACHNWGGGASIPDYFIGDYEGMAGTGTGFVAAFGVVDSNNNTSVFARRVGP